MSAIWNGLQDLLGGTLSFFYDLIPNFGIAIILLTIFIGLLLFPLTLKQTRSMKAMQEIQPEIKRLQRELKHDRQAQQQAMMELYRERGVNPAAGCLPLLLQMPIWFALFSVLRSFAGSNPTGRVPSGSALEDAVISAVEGGTSALDFLWMNLTLTPSEVFGNDGIVTSLPYIITIAIVMVTAYWQQRQTMARQQKDGPQEKQPGQAILKIFPFFFGFISFSLPAGLVVYFAASQIFRIGQQAMILRMDANRSATVTESKPSSQEAAPKENTKESRSGATPPAPRPAQRRPQGSKKKRGKKRRRR